MKKANLEGLVFNQLTALRPAGYSTADGKRVWVFLCSCGTIIERAGRDVTSGNTKSCGCLRTAMRKASKNKKHGHAKTSTRPSSPTYNSWFAMKSRCRTLTDSEFKNYGAVGICYDPRWEGFEAFLEDMGERPEGTSLDRRDGAKGYSKENCRWATPKEQVDNRKCTRKFEFEGEVYTITDVANTFDIPREKAKYWLTEKGFSIAELLECVNG